MEAIKCILAFKDMKYLFSQLTKENTMNPLTNMGLCGQLIIESRLQSTAQEILVSTGNGELSVTDPRISCQGKADSTLATKHSKSASTFH